MSNGLDTTFQLLATTKNEAVVVVLDAALRSENSWVRSRAIDAMIARRSVAAGHRLIEQWNALSEEERQKVDCESDWLVDAMLQDLEGDVDAVERTIQIAQALHIERLAVPLIVLAESHQNYGIRRAALEAVMSIVTPIGDAARQDRDRPSVRGPILNQSEQSLKGFDQHRNKGLLDAFLVVSTWSDRQLRSVLSDTSPAADAVRSRFAESTTPEVISLLAAALQQRRCPPSVRSIIASREGDAFRDALLDTIGGPLSPSVRLNLEAIGMPACLMGGVRLMEQLTEMRRISLALVYSVLDTDEFRIVEMLIAALEEAPSGLKGTLLHALAEAPELDPDRLLRAAVVLAKEPTSHDWENQPNAALLDRLLQLMDQGDAMMERVVHRVLTPLRAEKVIEMMGCFRPATQRRIGQLVMRTDSEALERVQTNLRHPVVHRRLQAISAAQAFGIVDAISESLIGIALDDHREARLAAMEAIGSSSLLACRKAIEEIAAGPDSSIRDAALALLTSKQRNANAP